MSENIDTMTGPELSAAVAREVMGWKFRDNQYGAHWADQQGIWTADKASWSPHADRNDAHRVLKRCEELGLVVETWKQIRCGGPGCPAEWSDWDYMTISPLEVCRAALRAVRGSK